MKDSYHFRLQVQISEAPSPKHSLGHWDSSPKIQLNLKIMLEKTELEDFKHFLYFLDLITKVEYNFWGYRYESWRQHLEPLTQEEPNPDNEIGRLNRLEEMHKNESNQKDLKSCCPSLSTMSKSSFQTFKTEHEIFSTRCWKIHLI